MALAKITTPPASVVWDNIEEVRIAANISVDLIACHNAGREWPDAKNNAAKEAFKEALFGLQKSKCAYCRRDIKDETGLVEIDHILPKASKGNQIKWTSNAKSYRRSTAGYALFTYTLKNLALTCKRCNNKKGTYDCRKDRSLPSGTIYPAAKELVWVHPYLHRYSDHITITAGFVFSSVNSSPEGQAVIDACKLNTLAALEIKARLRHIKRSADFHTAVWSLVPHLKDWSDAQLVDFLVNQFPNMRQQAVQAVAELRRRMLEPLF